MGLLKIPSTPKKYLYDAPCLVDVPTGSAAELLEAAKVRLSSLGMRLRSSDRGYATTWPHGILTLPKNWSEYGVDHKARLLWHESAHAAQRKSMGPLVYGARYGVGVGWWFAMECEAEQQEAIACKKLGLPYDIEENEDSLMGKVYGAVSWAYDKKDLRKIFRDVMLKRLDLIDSGTPIA